MIISFTLSMPNRGSWNGAWSGSDRFYAITRNLPNAVAARTLQCSSYHYSWSDGWGANVEVKQVDAKEARRIRHKSQGFSGYDWMVDSIIKHGKIYASHEEPKP